MLIFKIINPKSRHMRNLTLFVFVALFVSCGNPKAKIVEQIKAYKDSSRLVLDSIVKITVDETLKYEELYFTNGKPDYDNKVGNPSIMKAYDEYKEKNRDEQLRLKWKGSVYQNKIDSLELELKKY